MKDKWGAAENYLSENKLISNSLLSSSVQTKFRSNKIQLNRPTHLTCHFLRESIV